MATSSIHIEAGKIGFFAHNDRSRPTKNSIFSDEKNFVNCSAQEAIEKFKTELEKRTQAYIKNHKNRKKLNSKTITHLSAIVNLNKNHAAKDIQKVCKYLEEKFDTKIVQFSIHRDEGHIDPDTKKPIKNYHAHVEMLGIDSNGNSIRRKLTRRALIELQSKVADILIMERGICYAKEKKERPKRLNTYDFKKAKELESNAKRATQKMLKNEIRVLREELKTSKAKRKDYAKLEEQQKKLKEQIRNKELTEQQLKEQIEKIRELAFSNLIFKKTKKRVPYKKLFEKEQEQKEELKLELLEAKTQISTLQEKLKSLTEILNQANTKIDSLKNDLEHLAEQNKSLDKKNIELKEKIAKNANTTQKTQKETEEYLTITNSDLNSLNSKFNFDIK
jgi:hypothetical protein